MIRSMYNRRDALLRGGLSAVLLVSFIPVICSTQFASIFQYTILGAVLISIIMILSLDFGKESHIYKTDVHNRHERL